MMQHPSFRALAMGGSYLRVALRGLRKHRGFTAINVVGLALGLAASVLLQGYVRFERSYDDFHRAADRTYRVRLDFEREGAPPTAGATTFAAVGPAMAADFPEVEAFVRIVQRFGGGAVHYEDRAFRETLVYHADASFFDLFDYPMLRGDRRTALREPNAAVLSEEAARRYFGEADPLGRQIVFGPGETYVVTGVAASPENSHFKFDFLFSYASLVPVFGDDVYTSWTWWDFRTYVRLRPGADPAQLAARLPAFVARHRAAVPGERVVLGLQPLGDIHLRSDLLFEARANGDARSVAVLSLVSVLVLLIAWVNYLNLATAQAMRRAKEVGVRKVVGARQGQLVVQFLCESAVVGGLALVLAGGLVALALPAFGALVGKPLRLELVRDGWFWAGLVAAFGGGSLLAGLYPALVLASLRPAAVLKGRGVSGARGTRLRQGLLVTQFAASVWLVAGTLVVYEQVGFMQRQDLGVDIDQTLVVDLPEVVRGADGAVSLLESYRQELLQDPRVRSVAVSSEVPGTPDPWANRARRLTATDVDYEMLYVVSVDYDYLDAYGHEVVAGRRLARDFPADARSIVLNETAVRVLGFESPEAAVGERIRVRRDTLAVVGVVADHHQQGLHRAYYQIGFRVQPEEYRYLSVKVQPGDLPGVIASIRRSHQAFFPGDPFSYAFLDDVFDAQYHGYRRFGAMIGVFAVLAVVVASLGLLGLSAFLVARRTKEIGIRKVMGAGVASLLVLLTRSFVQVVLAGIVVAVPLAWVATDRWLSGFAFRIEPSAGTFVAAGAGALGVALLTVAYQVVRAALADPVRSLRYE